MNYTSKDGEVDVAEIVRLALQTADDRPLMHKFYRHECEPASLLVTFPGDNYGVDGPLLYYPGEVLRESGWDTLAITYGYKTAMEEMSLEVIPGLIDECTKAVHFVLAERDYSRIGLVGKSLGANVVAHLCQVEPALKDARAAFLTPPLGNPLFDSSFTKLEQRAYMAMGTRDRFYNTERLEALKEARQFTLTLIEGADHSMDVPGDLDASLEAVRRVVSEVVAMFLQD
jgi:hypothetical protein